MRMTKKYRVISMLILLLWVILAFDLSAQRSSTSRRSFSRNTQRPRQARRQRRARRAPSPQVKPQPKSPPKVLKKIPESPPKVLKKIEEASQFYPLLFEARGGYFFNSTNSYIRSASFPKEFDEETYKWSNLRNVFAEVRMLGTLNRFNYLLWGMMPFNLGKRTDTVTQETDTVNIVKRLYSKDGSGHLKRERFRNAVSHNSVHRLQPAFFFEGGLKAGLNVLDLKPNLQLITGLKGDVSFIRYIGRGGTRVYSTHPVTNAPVAYNALVRGKAIQYELFQIVPQVYVEMQTYLGRSFLLSGMFSYSPATIWIGESMEYWDEGGDLLKRVVKTKGFLGQTIQLEGDMKFFLDRFFLSLGVRAKHTFRTIGSLEQNNPESFYEKSPSRAEGAGFDAWSFSAFFGIGIGIGNPLSESRRASSIEKPSSPNSKLTVPKETVPLPKSPAGNKRPTGRNSRAARGPDSRIRRR